MCANFFSFFNSKPFAGIYANSVSNSAYDYLLIKPAKSLCIVFSKFEIFQILKIFKLNHC